jgi:hypothetical protein
LNDFPALQNAEHGLIDEPLFRVAESLRESMQARKTRCIGWDPDRGTLGGTFDYQWHFAIANIAVSEPSPLLTLGF